MQIKQNKARAVCTALVALALASLSFAGSASAKLTGIYTVFEQCPWTDPEAYKCVHSLTESGEVVLGSKTVPIVNPVTLQGAYTFPNEATTFSKMIAAKNGVTLSKSPQPVPGGLVGLVPPESSPPLVKAALKLVLENGFTGVNSTVELAKPVNEVLISELHLGEKEDVALRMPVKVRLENPFLGNNCYVGSNSNPIVLELTSGKTAPPPPNESIEGTSGTFEFLDGGEALRLKDAELVDNSFGAPAASGCGGLLSFLVDPIIALQLGDTSAGHNTARLKTTITVSAAASVKANDELTP